LAKVKSNPPASRTQSTPPAGATPEAPPTVSASWLLTAFITVLIGAAISGYGALCLLFYQGQWQLLFHPSRAITATPASTGLAFDDIHFDVTETGIPQLSGWWIPAAPASAHAADTILYLHGASGSLSDTVPALAELHSLGINVFAIDYRGFGHSTGAHPTERLATADASASWIWLTDSRSIPPGHIIVYGDGAGAVFAAHLGAEFAPAGIILQDPIPTAREILLADARARILPLFLLQNQRLDPTADLISAHLPRLFLDRHDGSTRAHQLFLISSYPRTYADLRRSPPSTVDSALRGFLDEVLR
jgi:uncharacterized protein